MADTGRRPATWAWSGGRRLGARNGRARRHHHQCGVAARAGGISAFRQRPGIGGGRAHVVTFGAGAVLRRVAAWRVRHRTVAVAGTKPTEPVRRLSDHALHGDRDVRHGFFLTCPCSPTARSGRPSARITPTSPENVVPKLCRSGLTAQGPLRSADLVQRQNNGNRAPRSPTEARSGKTCETASDLWKRLRIHRYPGVVCRRAD
jgi:hypothetical protein